MLSDLRKRNLVMVAATTLSAMCPCPRAHGREALRTATDSIRATRLTCPDGTIPPGAADTRQHHDQGRQHRAEYAGRRENVTDTGRNAAHCPGRPLQPNGAPHPAARDAPAARR